MRRAATVLAALALAGCGGGTTATNSGQAAPAMSPSTASSSTMPGNAAPSSATPTATPTATPFTPTPEASPSQTRRGATAATWGDTLTVTLAGADTGEITVIEKPKAFRKEPGEFGSESEEGTFVLYTLTMQALDTAPDVWSVSPFDFYVRDEDGNRYEPSYSSAFERILDASMLESAELNAGERQKGFLSFDVPSARGLTFVYAPSGRAIGEWS